MILTLAIRILSMPDSSLLSVDEAAKSPGVSQPRYPGESPPGGCPRDQARTRPAYCKIWARMPSLGNGRPSGDDNRCGGCVEAPGSGPSPFTRTRLA